jgi:phosphoribosylaminoimidazolecarboxamide formyltransferase/IMP cyclohydrolase
MVKKKTNKSSAPHKYALLSVFDKTGIVELSNVLAQHGYQIISTGGTAKTLTDNGVKIIPIQDITGNPESFDGRMKTISFQIESGILYDRSNPKHVKEAKELNIKSIDIVVCNLYPFEQTTSNSNVTLANAIESIDVGGPTMIRAAAKNFKNVLVIVDPKDYESMDDTFKNDTIERRKALAAKAFQHLSFYDAQIARYLSVEQFPNEIAIPGRKLMDLRYGENPHQKAAVYIEPNTKTPIKNLKKLWGRELSLVNITDINAGLASVSLFKEPSAVVIKHNSPCGIALGKNSFQALSRAIEADPESAFGGVIVLNSTLDLKTAKVIVSFKDERKANIDIVAAPKAEQKAIDLLSTLRKSMGIYTFESQELEVKSQKLDYKFINGGFIVQDADTGIEESFKDWEVVTKKKPSKKQLEQMKIAWKFISRIKSNAVIVIDKSLPMTRGIGCGQTSRVRSTKIALEQAGKYKKGAILASDSFFPFDDSVKLAAKNGIAAIIQQGDSVNDKLSIDAANKAGIPMVFTHRRAFWH